MGLYIAFFPQLIAGPIVRYKDFRNQINNRTLSTQKFVDGLYKFLIGFNKKMLLANILSNVADEAFAGADNTVLMAWMGAICYTLQIYYDFSGYSDMAIGLAKIFGFELLKNFDYPYTSRTVTEFWRRWHMSLGQWFRDYVYFPLGGSRVDTKKRIIFNLMVVWLLTGIWHGANTTFIAWGIAYGIIISVEKVLQIPLKLKNHKYMAIAYQIFTMLSVTVGWVVFRSKGLHAAIYYIMDMFGMRQNYCFQASDWFYIREYALFLILGVLFSFPVCKYLKEKIEKGSATAGYIADTIAFGFNIALFIVGISYMVISAHNPFIYFNF